MFSKAGRCARVDDSYLETHVNYRERIDMLSIPLCPQTSSRWWLSGANSQTTSGYRSLALVNRDWRSACQAVVDAFTASCSPGGAGRGAVWWNGEWN